MTLQEKYDRALERRKRFFGRIKGGMGEKTQSELDSMTDEVIKYRNKLIESGLWKGPIPVPVKAKYRRR